jgi:hypothetical protein
VHRLLCCLYGEYLHVMPYCSSVCPDTAFSCLPIQVTCQMPWICTTVQQGYGRQLSSAWHAINLQRHRLETWLWPRAVGKEVCCRAGVWRIFYVIACVLGTVFLIMMQQCGSICLATACCLMHSSAGVGTRASNAVDLYNRATGVWSTARLSVARYNLAAASVENEIMFAGGDTASGSALL